MYSSHMVHFCSLLQDKAKGFAQNARHRKKVQLTEFCWSNFGWLEMHTSTNWLWQVQNIAILPLPLFVVFPLYLSCVKILQWTTEVWFQNKNTNWSDMMLEPFSLNSTVSQLSFTPPGHPKHFVSQFCTTRPQRVPWCARQYSSNLRVFRSFCQHELVRTRAHGVICLTYSSDRSLNVAKWAKFLGSWKNRTRSISANRTNCAWADANLGINSCSPSCPMRTHSWASTSASGLGSQTINAEIFCALLKKAESQLLCQCASTRTCAVVFSWLRVICEIKRRLLYFGTLCSSAIQKVFQVGPQFGRQMGNFLHKTRGKFHAWRSL